MLVMTTTHIAQRTAQSVRTVPSIAFPRKQQQQQQQGGIDTSRQTSVMDWAHLRYDDEDLDVFDALLDQEHTEKLHW